jgi:membrane protein YqaA with SNARE-associated domain
METIVQFLREFGAAGLFIHSMIDAIIFPIPALFLQVSLSTVNPETSILLATVGYIGCLIGTPIGYFIGKTSGSYMLNKVMKKKWLDSATEMFRKHGEAAILIGSFTPIPFKLFTILSGVMNYPLWKLLGYAAIGRAVKFYAVGILFYVYGRSAEHMVDQVLGIILLVAGVIIAALWLIVRSIRKKKKHKRTLIQMEDK